MSTQYFKTPNIPTKMVSCVLVDRRAEDTICALNKRGIKTILSVQLDLYNAVATHPDMQLHHLGGNTFVSVPNAVDYYRKVMPDAQILCGVSSLHSHYPQDIAYNVCRIGEKSIHNTKFTDRIILDFYDKIGVKQIHVKQGYSKCSVCVVSENAIITSDIGIFRAAENAGLEVLLISSEGISLQGMSGFIGGASGLLSPKLLAVNGNISLHPDAENILRFCSKHGVEICSLHNDILTDIGSIIPLF